MEMLGHKKTTQKAEPAAGDSFHRRKNQAKNIRPRQVDKKTHMTPTIHIPSPTDNNRIKKL